MTAATSEMALSEQEFKLYQALFAQKLGIHLPDQKITLVGTRLWKRLRACGISSYTSYFQLINQPEQEAELCRALELITTNETYFFREPRHFDYLREHVLPAFLPASLFLPGSHWFSWGPLRVSMAPPSVS